MRHTIHGNVLRCAEEDQGEPPPGEGPYGRVRLGSIGHDPVDVPSQPDHGETRNGLDGQNPTLSATDLGRPPRIYNGTPK